MKHSLKNSKKHSDSTLLYDFYSNLLTDNQKRIFQLYFFDDYTMDEISSILKISKPAVSESIKITGLILQDYETKLKLVTKHKKRLSIFNDFKNDKDFNASEFIQKLEEIEYK